MHKTTITRKDFIAKYIQTGLTYDQACRVYACTVSVVEDAISNGSKVGFGHVGAIAPKIRPPRKVRMGFKKENGETVKAARVYFVDSRVHWVFRLYRTFAIAQKFNST